MAGCMKVLLLLLLGILVFSCAPFARSDNPEQAQLARLAIDEGALIVDVRRPNEFALGHIDGAINIPHDQISTRLPEILRYKNESIVLYCRSGRRSGIAEGVLRSNGFTKTINAGGYSELKRLM